jgi:hypothetical protein
MELSDCEVCYPQQDPLNAGSNPATSMCVFREFYIISYSSLDSYKLSTFIVPTLMSVVHQPMLVI